MERSVWNRINSSIIWCGIVIAVLLPAVTYCVLPCTEDSHFKDIQKAYNVYKIFRVNTVRVPTDTESIHKCSVELLDTDVREHEYGLFWLAVRHFPKNNHAGCSSFFTAFHSNGTMEQVVCEDKDIKVHTKLFDFYFSHSANDSTMYCVEVYTGNEHFRDKLIQGDCMTVTDIHLTTTQRTSSTTALVSDSSQTTTALTSNATGTPDAVTLLHKSTSIPRVLSTALSLDTATVSVPSATKDKALENVTSVTSHTPSTVSGTVLYSSTTLSSKITSASDPRGNNDKDFESGTVSASSPVLRSTSANTDSDISKFFYFTAPPPSGTNDADLENETTDSPFLPSASAKTESDLSTASVSKTSPPSKTNDAGLENSITSTSSPFLPSTSAEIDSDLAGTFYSELTRTITSVLNEINNKTLKNIPTSVTSVYSTRSTPSEPPTSISSDEISRSSTQDSPTISSHQDTTTTSITIAKVPGKETLADKVDILVTSSQINKSTTKRPINKSITLAAVATTSKSSTTLQGDEINDRTLKNIPTSVASVFSARSTPSEPLTSISLDASSRSSTQDSPTISSFQDIITTHITTAKVPGKETLADEVDISVTSSQINKSTTERPSNKSITLAVVATTSKSSTALQGDEILKKNEAAVASSKVTLRPKVHRPTRRKPRPIPEEKAYDDLSDSIVPLVIGLVIGLLCLILIIAVIIVKCRDRKEKKRKEREITAAAVLPLESESKLLPPNVNVVHPQVVIPPIVIDSSPDSVSTKAIGDDISLQEDLKNYSEMPEPSQWPEVKNCAEYGDIPKSTNVTPVTPSTHAEVNFPPTTPS